PADACSKGDWTTIEQLAREAVNLASSVNAA
ncbi:MAG: hypothetical protein RLZZ602_33, partial [Pseudomonadota bacterium]